jgi:hypothetical protein
LGKLIVYLTQLKASLGASKLLRLFNTYPYENHSVVKGFPIAKKNGELLDDFFAANAN